MRPQLENGARPPLLAQTVQIGRRFGITVRFRKARNEPTRTACHKHDVPGHCNVARSARGRRFTYPQGGPLTIVLEEWHCEA